MKKRHKKKSGKKSRMLGMMEMGMNVKSIYSKTMHHKKASRGSILQRLAKTKKTRKLKKVI